MNIIGLSGYARSGKDEAAQVLVEEFGFTRVAFADKLREFLSALNPLVRVEPIIDPRYLDPVGYEIIRVKNVIDQYGWDGYKETIYVDEIRTLLQRLGTEAGRETLWDSIWIDAAFRDLDESGSYVFTDVRFPNEYDAIRHRAGRLWRITRTNVGPATAEDGTVHKSETSLDNHQFDKYLSNNGTLDQFKAMVSYVVKLT